MMRKTLPVLEAQRGSVLSVLCLVASVLGLSCVGGCVSDEIGDGTTLAAYQEKLARQGPQQRQSMEGEEPSEALGLLKPVAPEEKLTPDLVALGKGIGSGMPASAVAARSDVIGVLGAGEMSSTMGGNPVACAAVVAVVEIFEREKLEQNALRIGGLMKSRLDQIRENCPWVGYVRVLCQHCRFFGAAARLRRITDRSSAAEACTIPHWNAFSEVGWAQDLQSRISC